MATVNDRRRRLYGNERTMESEMMRENLTKSVVLQDGDYNFTKDKLKSGNWNTSSKTDFTGQAVDVSSKSVPIGQLNHHFELKSSEADDKKCLTSLSHDDYNRKLGVKTVPCPVDRTVNWTDMAPQYQGDATLGQTEYNNQFMTTDGTLNGPTFPLINTCKVQLPLDPQKHQRLRDTSSVVFGTDGQRAIQSEQQGSFSADRLNERTAPYQPSGNISSLKNNSHVFRSGDYNNTSGGSFETNNMTDYGPRTQSPASLVTAKLKQQENPNLILDPSYTADNYLSKHAQQNIVPGVHKDAKSGRNDQENAHFQFGNDISTTESLYSKDFLLAAQKPRSRPTFYKTPSSGQIIQSDPVFSTFGKTQNSVDFSRKPVEHRLMSNGKTEADNNMARRHGRNVSLTSSDKANPKDSLVSLSHGDFMPPPSTFKPMTPKRAPAVQFDFLKANDALPYSSPIRGSEAKTTFTGTLMSGYDALQRRRDKDVNCRAGVHLNRDTHFTIGAENLAPDHSTENRAMYTGRPAVTGPLRPAGTSEIIPDQEFRHLNMSENTGDLFPNDPYTVSTKEALRARNLCMSERISAGKAQTPFETSVMRNDYVPMDTRRFTEDQSKRIEQVNKIYSQPLEKSHLFHTDTSGANNMVSTAMNDFVQPEYMTGPKMLGAR